MPDLNTIIKKKLKQRLMKKKAFSVVNAINKTLMFTFLGGLPLLAIGFTAFLSWQVNSSFDSVQPTKQALASEFNNKKIEVMENEANEDKNENLKSKVKGIQSTGKLPKESFIQAPLIKQKYKLSCEVASLQMALKHFDIDIDQDTLLSQLGVSQPVKMANIGDKIIWGDPDEAFVGDVNGWFTGKDEKGKETLANATGWGVNNGPIADLARKYRPNSKEIDNATVEDLKIALAEKHPVIWWHTRDDAVNEKIQIYSRTGKEITYQQTHVNLMVGYKTDKTGNTIYLFNDPYFGKLELSESKMLEQWSRFGNNIVVVK